MFELKYRITDGDMKRVNKSVMWTYFIPYIIVAAVGLAAGIAATVLRVSTSITVLGIILTVLGAILAVCAIVLAIMPKCFVLSVILPDEQLERTVKLDEKEITVSTENQSDIVFGYGEVTASKTKDYGLLLYFGSDKVLPVFVADKQLAADISAFVCSARSKQKGKPQAAQPAPDGQEPESVAEAPADGAEAPSEVTTETPSEAPPADGAAE